ncbi:MAG TPA: transposase [Ktedonobacteraceae bacterium]|nr:transposase [Ktedonobacteraceae bacterium]
MSHQETIAHWQEEIAAHLPSVSRTQARLLAWWSYGIVLANTCGLSSVSYLLAEIFGCKENSMRQRLREWHQERTHKRGAQRREVEVSTCFAPLLSWILHHWNASDKRLALALDATTLGERFTVLVLAVQYRGTALPVAWQVVPAKNKGGWKPHWQRLLAHLRPAVPADWEVIVLADRGLYGKWLFEQIEGYGWHPFLRINERIFLHPVEGTSGFVPASSLAAQPGESWQGVVDLSRSQPGRLRCRVLVTWQANQEERWVIVTDAEYTHACVAWYGMRFWIESGFRQMKRGGWHWHLTRMNDARRATRLWLALALATLWSVRLGLPSATDERPASSHRATEGRSWPHLSCQARGRLRVLAHLGEAPVLEAQPLIPQPWPSALPTRGRPTSAWIKKRRRKDNRR